MAPTTALLRMQNIADSGGQASAALPSVAASDLLTTKHKNQSANIYLFISQKRKSSVSKTKCRQRRNSKLKTSDS